MSHVYVRALTIGCFYSHISTETFRRALTASVESCAEIKSGPSVAYVTKSGRVWRKVPESDARSVGRLMRALCANQRLRNPAMFSFRCNNQPRIRKQETLREVLNCERELQCRM